MAPQLAESSRLTELFRTSAGSVSPRGDLEHDADWNEYQKQLGARIAEIGKLSTETVRGYAMLNGANAKTTHLGEKVRQLISLAAAVTLGCDDCIVVHTDAALTAGASREKIAEALGVAVAGNAGAAMVSSSGVTDAVEAKTTPTIAPASA